MTVAAGKTIQELVNNRSIRDRGRCPWCGLGVELVLSESVRRLSTFGCIVHVKRGRGVAEVVRGKRKCGGPGEGRWWCCCVSLETLLIMTNHQHQFNKHSSDILTGFQFFRRHRRQTNYCMRKCKQQRHSRSRNA